jgi:HD-like signal output (HDOD) protein
MLPDVALRILALSKSIDVSFDAIVTLVESDPMFAMSVLKIAASPLYAGHTSPRTIHQALLRLGLGTMTEICMEAAMNARVFRAPGHEGAMRVLRDHSVAVAHLARLVAQRTPSHADAAFTLGLLHEVGQAAGIVALATPALWPLRPDASRMWPLLAAARGSMTEKLVRAWKLPADLATGILSSGTNGDGSRAAVLVADGIATDLGFGLPGEKVDVEALERAREILDLKHADVRALSLEGKKLLSKVV